MFRSRQEDNKGYHKLFLILAFIAGCSTLGLQQAKNFEDKLVYSYGIHTAIQKSATASLNAPKPNLTSVESREILKMADSARTFLDLAQSADLLGNLEDANVKYFLATTTLEQLQKYLREKGVN